MLSFTSRLHQNMAARRSGQPKTSSKAQGSFAESIGMDEKRDADEDCDSSSCSSSCSSEEEDLSHLRIHSQQGSFPSSCPAASSGDQNTSFGVISMPLPIVFEEDDECETSVSNTDEEDQEEDRDDDDGSDEDKENVTESRKVEEEEEEEKEDQQQPQQEQEEDASILSANRGILTEAGLHSTSKTICSNTDATCQTFPTSLSQCSSGDASLEYLSTQNLEEELDSRLNAILAMKEVIFAQRLTVKETTKDKKFLTTKLANRNRMNKRLYMRNLNLEKELVSVREDLRVANMKLLQQQQQQQKEEDDDDDDCSTIKEESIFELLNRINEKRKRESVIVIKNEIKS